MFKIFVLSKRTTFIKQIYVGQVEVTSNTIKELLLRLSTFKTKWGSSSVVRAG